VSGTPRGDGVPNLFKYLYDIDPTIPMTSADWGALPAATIDDTTVPGVQYLTLTFQENAALNGVTVNLQTSPDMQTWTTVTPDIQHQVGSNAQTGDPIVEMGVIYAGTGKQFLRLNVASQ
jgi:hypothetical protein